MLLNYLGQGKCFRLTFVAIRLHSSYEHNKPDTDIHSMVQGSERSGRQGAITARIKKAAFGNFGDHHNVRGPIWELRIDTGPGYRVYYAQEGLTVYLLLVGGSKHSQTKDIERAEALWNEIKGK